LLAGKKKNKGKKGCAVALLFLVRVSPTVPKKKAQSRKEAEREVGKGVAPIL